MRIIPAIDVMEGKCVRLTQGNFSTQKTYYEDPLEVAKMFESHGVKYLHLVDLEGARNGKICNQKVLEKIANKTQLVIDFGGGIKTDEDIKIAFDAGAAQITGGSIAVKNPIRFESWIQSYGSEKIILGADVSNGFISISGWQEESKEAIIPFIDSYTKKGLTTVICTDISKDGMLQGPGIDLYRSIIKEFPSLKLIASGGVSCLDDLLKIKDIGCEGVIVGKAIYEGNISLKALENFIIESQ